MPKEKNPKPEKPKKPKKPKKSKKPKKPKQPKVHKKRGRKPKGGKIIAKQKIAVATKKQDKPNIILHLKCSSSDISDISPQLSYDVTPHIEGSQLQWENVNCSIKKTSSQCPRENNEVEKDEPHNKIIWNKLKQLSKNLHFNDVSDKKSNCFWCTYPFDTPPIFIPKQERNNIIEVYGCFCSPQCACAYLTKEHIDSSTFWERHALLNNIYGKIYQEKERIKPAPDPYHTLEKYYGSLSIGEYRKLFKNDRILVIVDKPLTKILPELHDEKNEIPPIYTNLLKKHHVPTVHYRLKRSIPKHSKNNILNSTFNLKSTT